MSAFSSSSVVSHHVSASLPLCHTFQEATMDRQTDGCLAVLHRDSAAQSCMEQRLREGTAVHLQLPIKLSAMT